MNKNTRIKYSMSKSSGVFLRNIGAKAPEILPNILFERVVSLNGSFIFAIFSI